MASGQYAWLVRTFPPTALGKAYEHHVASSTNLALREIENELNEVTEWYQLGVQLKLPIARLEEIEKDYTENKRRKTEVLIWWLRNVQVSWEKLVCALEKMGGYNNVVQKLKKKLSLIPDSHVMSTASLSSTNGTVIADSDGTHQNLTTSGRANSDETTVSRTLKMGKELRGIYHKVKADPPLAEHDPDVYEDELVIQTYEIRCKYLKLFMKVRNLLMKLGVTVRNFVSFLQEVPGYARISLFDVEIISELRNSSDLIDVFGTIKNYCSWFNHSLLDLIIDTYCDDNERIKKDHQDYCTHLQKYCKHRIKNLPVTNGYGNSSETNGRNSMIIKVDSEWDAIRIQDLQEVVFTIAHILNVSRHTLYLCCVKKGCVQLMFMVPNYISDEIFPLTSEQETAMMEMGVSSLQCGSCYFSCQGLNIATQSYKMTAELGIFMQLLVADGSELELFHTGGEQMLSAALNLWVHYFCHPLKSLMSRMPPKEVTEKPDNEAGHLHKKEAMQTLDYREEVPDLSAIPHISPSLGLQPGHARRDLALARSCSKRQPPIWRQRLSEEAERLGQSRVELSRREALASLITLLLQPMSPPDSNSEEEEKPTTTAYMEEEEEETKRALQLILDLVRISKSHTDASSPPEPSVASLQQAADVAAMRHHDCEKLQNLISELDRLAVEVDPASRLHRRRPRRREDRREHSRSRSPCQPCSPSTEESQVSSEGTTEYQEANTSLDTDTDQFTEANEGSSPDLQEGEGEEESDQAVHMESQRTTHTYPTQLSPVQETPEYSRRSTSVESISHLESDLNTALSRLDTETSDLRVDEDVLASFESQMGRERPSKPVTTHSQAGGDTSLSSLHSTTGSVSTEGDATVWSTSLSQSEDVFEDCSEDFSTIPATPPSLGLKEGHDRRDLAVARSSSKRRPPTRKSTTNPKQTSEVVSDKQSEEVIVEEEEEEMDENENRKLDFVPTLTDQIHLLKPGFPMPSGPDTESESTLATSSNLTEPETPTHSQASEKETTPAPTHSQASEETTLAPTHSQASEKDVSVESRRQGSAEPESKAAQEPSLHIISSEPPWIEMRRKSKDTPPPSVPPTPEKPPKIPMLEPDKKDSEDSIYDTLVPLETPSHEAMYETLPFTKYLHQTIAEQQQQKQDSPHPSPSPHPSLSPQLPPRNPTHKVPVVEEREGRSRHRHSSRHHSSSSPSERPSASSKEKDRHGSESSRKHRSHSSDRERRSSSSRRSSSDKHSTDKHSSSHSRSREHSSSHSERHSDKHRSHSSEKHSHGSSKSDGKKKASNPAKVKDSPKEEGKKHSSSSSRDSSKSKSESSRPKSDSSKSKSESSRPKSDSSKSKSESSKSSKSKGAEKTPEKSRASSLKASSTPTDDKALMKSTSLTSLSSVRSQGGSSLVLESGKETEV